MTNEATGQRVIQRGLFTRSETELNNFADRVSNFNKEKGFIVVEMEGRESDPDEQCPFPHWKVELDFKTRAYAKAFWTDPAYAVQVYVPVNDNKETVN